MTKTAIKAGHSEAPNVEQLLLQNPISQVLYGPLGLALLLSVSALAFVSLLNGRQKNGKLATSAWATSTHLKAARLKGCKQIEKQQHNRVCLFVGTPQTTEIKRTKKKTTIYIPPDSSTLYFPDSQRHHFVFGGPGSGKTFSTINPLIYSALLQGKSIFLYDFKYSHQASPSVDDAKGQSGKIAGFAAELGYNITVFAPGFPESCIANPLDFIRSKTDVDMARELAVVLNKNFKLSSKGGSDNSFFSNAGEQLTQAVFLLAKDSKYPDIMMCQAILGLPNLIERLKLAYSRLNPWVRASFDQFISASGSEATAASIVTTASAIFSRFMSPSTMSATCGKSTIPLDMTKKQLVIFGMDKERRSSTGPLLASILHLLVTRNVSGVRSTSLGLFLDEAYTLYLPSKLDWLMQERETGLFIVLAAQSPSMMAETYGKEIADAMIAGCGHKWFFCPQDDIASERFSKMVGTEEIEIAQTSKNIGNKGENSRTLSNQKHTRPLYEASQFNRLPEGKAVVVSCGIRSKTEASIPLLQQIKIPQCDIDKEKRSVSAWYHLQRQMRGSSTLKEPTDVELREHYLEAERILPLPDEKKSEKVELANQFKAI